MEAVQNTKTTNNPTFRSSPKVLPLEESGQIRYPILHSVFAATDQESILRAPLLSEAKLKEDINQNPAFKQNHNYKDLGKGSAYLIRLANSIRASKADSNIYDLLEKLSQQTDIPNKPGYRMRILSNQEKQKDFEVIIITGRGIGRTRTDHSFSEQEDERRFLYDGKILRHAFENSSHFKNKCKTIQLVQNPSTKELEEAVAERATSARKHGRNLVIFYSGHGDTNYYQLGLGESKGLEGDMLFEFEFGKSGKREEYFSEESYKTIMQKHAADIPTIHIIHSCKSGAAISANEDNLLELYQRA